MAYWVSRGVPSEDERSLTSFIGGTSIEAEGANEFFADLLDKVEALETFGGNDPLSTPVGWQPRSDTWTTWKVTCPSGS
jgi:hypothetical protein